MKINYLIILNLFVSIFYKNGLSQLPNFIPVNNLEVYYSFANNASDHFNNCNGVVNGATLTNDANGIPNSAYSFNGSNNFIDIPTEFVNGQTLSSQTFRIKFKIDQSGGYGLWNKDGYWTETAIYLYSDNSIGLFWAFPNYYNSIRTSPNTIPIGTWHDVIFIVHNNSVIIYINGIQQNSYQSNSVTSSNLSYSHSGTCGINYGYNRFGFNKSSCNPNSYLKGQIDEFGLWSRALTNCEIQALYQGSQLTSTITPQSNTTFCQGGSVNLTASQGSTYLWSNGQTSHSISATTSGSYTVQVTDANGCVRTSAPTVVTVNPNPQVSISNNGSTTFCQGGTVTLTSTGANSYQWSNNQSGDSISVNTSGSFYTIGTDANGCIDTSNAISVVVNPNPQVTISSSGPTTFCQGSSVTLTSTGASTNQWSNNQTGNSISVSISGSFYTIGTDANGCSDTSNAISVVVNPNPQVTITSSGPTTFCSGGTVTLIGAGVPNSYQWSNNQSGNSISVNSSGSFYTIGTDANGCIDTSNTISVVVNPNPQVTITSSGPTTFCSGGTVTLIGSGVPNSYQWSNNQSGNSISVSTSGSFYTIGTDANGCIDTSNTISVVVNPNPTAVITPSGPTSFCLGDSVLLNGVQGLNNTWSNGQTGTSIWVFQSGVYQLQVMDGNGCQDSSSVQINVFPLPQLSISLQGDDAFCQGDSTILIGSGSITYLWSTGDTTSLIQVNSSGLYSFMGTDVNGCTSSSNQIPISVIDYPVVLTQPQDIQEQVGNNVVFSIGTQNTSNSFQWEGDLGLGVQTINNGGQYGGATTNQLTVSNITQNNNGQLFRCVVTNDICSVVSDTAILTIKPNSGFLDFSGGFTLNPNPTQNNITIQFQDPVNSNYSLLDFSGKELRIGKMEGEETTISVQSLPVGVYFIRIDGKQIRFIRN
jgi:hypothetical protein